MIMWFIFLIITLGTVAFKHKRRRMYLLASRIPSAAGELPVIGLAHKLSGNTEAIMDTLKVFSYESYNTKGVNKVWLGHVLYFVVTNPVDLELVLKTCLEKDDLHRFIRKVIGYGGIFAPVVIWRRRRKIMVPAFSPKILESFVEVFSVQSEVLVKRLTGCIGKDFTAWPYLSTYTLDSVCETAMGVKVNAQGDKDTPFLKALCQALNLVCERIFHLWLQPDWLYRLFPKYVEHQKCLEVMHSFTDQVIHHKRKEIEMEKNCDTEVDKNLDLNSCKRKSFLDLLINFSGGESGYTDVELREEVLTLTVAGADTSAVAIGYTLQLLGRYPSVQEKVYQELLEVFGNSDRSLVKEDLPKLKYLERVVKESLRLFPPVPFIIRKVCEDIELSSGYVVPAGSGIVCSIWGVHRDPNYWGPDAEHFDPDRFLPERFNLKHSCSYMPFSNGPRNCLGYQYALISIKTVLSAVLRRFKVVTAVEKSPVPQIRVKLDIMMKAVDDYEIALERRKCETDILI